MKSWFKKIAAVVLTVTTVFALTACGGSESGSGEVKDTISIAYDAQPSTFDPHTTGAIATAEITKVVFEKIFEMDADGKPQCQLAESYTTANDNKEWTFNLRKGVKFHNGEEMKADDVVASLNRWLGKCAQASKSIQTNGEQFEKVDDYTVKISLENPCITMPYLLSNFSQPAVIMPASIIASAGTGNLPVDKLIGTGSMKFAEWSVDNYVKLEKFDGYTPFTTESSGSWGDRTVYFNTAMIYFVTDTTTRINGLETGEYDISSNIFYSDFDRLSNMSGVHYELDDMADLTIVMNKSEGSRLHDSKWRQVINYAIDLNTIFEAAIPTTGTTKFYSTNACYYAKSSPWYVDMSQSVKQNKEKAKQLLAELNYDGTPIVMMTTEAYPFLYNATLVMKQQLEDVGLNVTLNVYDWGTMLTKISDKTAFDLYPMHYPHDNNPSSTNYIRKSTASGFTNDAQLDAYIKEMNAQPTEEAAQSFFKKTVMPYCVESAQITHLGDMELIYGVSDKVDGFKPYYGLKIWGVKVTD